MAIIIVVVPAIIYSIVSVIIIIIYRRTRGLYYCYSLIAAAAAAAAVTATMIITPAADHPSRFKRPTPSGPAVRETRGVRCVAYTETVVAARVDRRTTRSGTNAVRSQYLGDGSDGGSGILHLTVCYKTRINNCRVIITGILYLSFLRS